MKLYKRNNFGKPIVWQIDDIGDNVIRVRYGLVNKELHVETFSTTRATADEIKTRVNEKRKTGYKELSELYDNAPKIIADPKTLNEYLNKYLPQFNSGSEGTILPMLAKTLEDNKPFEKGYYTGQWKINGERCIITAEKHNDIFNPIRLRYFSRKGVEWNLSYMDEILIPVIPEDLINLMVEENVALDGELYLPGYNINQINSFIKNDTVPQHYKLQYWCYDIAVEGYSAIARYSLLEGYFGKYKAKINSLNEHLNNEEPFILLPTYDVRNYEDARTFRDSFVHNGFEGLIIRNDDSEYQFGKRNSSMFKFKPVYDGYFTIVDIIPQGKRISLPNFVLRNDINDDLFEVTINQPQDVQEEMLLNKAKYVGKYMLVEYRERSGVKEVPFHAKGIKIK